jgi:hypothetical protein
MSILQNPSPTRRYVNCFLGSNSRRGPAIHRIRKSHGLPALDGCPDAVAPTFERFRNRLKVMARLDPVRYHAPKPGRFELIVHFDEEPGLTEAKFMVHLMFDDASEDPCVELRFEPLSSVSHPGGNPYLY